MSEEKKTYVTTDRAGFVVAGQRIPADYETKPVRSKVGHGLQLTADEAEYELRQGTIELQEPAVDGSSVAETGDASAKARASKKPAPAAGDAA